MKSTGKSAVSKEREQESGNVALQESVPARRQAGERSPVADDAGGKSRADDVRLAAEGRDAGGCRRQFRPAESQGRFQDSGTASARSAVPATPAKARTRAGMAELTNAIQKFFIENSRLGIPVIFHEECLHGHAAHRRHELSAADRARRHVQSRAGRVAVHHDRRRGAAARHASGAHAGGRCGARSALGPRRGNLRRRSVPGVAHGHRRGARLPGRRHVPRQEARDRHAEASSPRTASRNPA